MVLCRRACPMPAKSSVETFGRRSCGGRRRFPPPVGAAAAVAAAGVPDPKKLRTVGLGVGTPFANALARSVSRTSAAPIGTALYVVPLASRFSFAGSDELQSGMPSSSVSALGSASGRAAGAPASAGEASDAGTAACSIGSLATSEKKVGCTRANSQTRCALDERNAKPNASFLLFIF